MHYTTSADITALSAKTGTDSSRLPFVDALRGGLDDHSVASPDLLRPGVGLGAAGGASLDLLAVRLRGHGRADLPGAGGLYDCPQPGWPHVRMARSSDLRRAALLPPGIAVPGDAGGGHRCRCLVRPWLPEDVVGPPPTAGQVVSHVFLLQFILGFERLSSGVWYVCVDFQLGLLLVGILLLRDSLSRICGRPLPRLPLLIGWVLAAVSLFYFNRNPDLNMWGVYFFGSFFVGMLVHYELADRRPPVLLVLYLLMMAAALAIQWRTRLAVGMTTGLLLYVSGRLGWLERWPKSPVIEYLGRISYSLFLIHFSVLLVVYAWWVRLEWTSPMAALAGMVLIYPLSLLAAIAFYHGVEVPCVRLSRPCAGRGANRHRAACRPSARIGTRRVHNSISQECQTPLAVLARCVLAGPCFALFRISSRRAAGILLSCGLARQGGERFATMNCFLSDPGREPYDAHSPEHPRRASPGSCSSGWR